MAKTPASDSADDSTSHFMPTEPGTKTPGFVHGYLVLSNGTEYPAYRSPNGIWWWHPLPASGPDLKRHGSWHNLLDHVGRTHPLEWVSLVRKTEHPIPTEHDWDDDDIPGLGRRCIICQMREGRDKQRDTACVGTAAPYEAGVREGRRLGIKQAKDHVNRRLWEGL